ncbi:DUF1858 domain-containing protein [Candidatus Woesearchaeota archaeon]|nr:DUF1858 domain-containing protein [Candidatus Woesearchaeota archaeon]
MEKITRQTTIQQIFDMHPDKAYRLASIMSEAGLHCIGCHASLWESLEQGMLAHGMSDKQIDALVEQLNAEVAVKVPLNQVNERLKK